MEKQGALVFLCMALLFVTLVAGIYAGQVVFGVDHAIIGSRQAELKALGVCSLSIPTRCVGTRGTLEGVYGVMMDIPGGYCYDRSCDIVAPPVEPSFSLAPL
ncbi:MAG: hypothetical protein WC695_01170 [Candidatus Omnitrophota bacterium]